MRKYLPNTIRLIFLILFTIVTIYPFMLMVFVSFMTSADFINNPLGLPSSFLNFENFELVFQRGRIIRAFFNSLLVASVALTIQIIFGSLVGYALTKMGFVRAKLFTVLFLIPLILPPQIIAVYLIFLRLGLLNTYFGLFIYYGAIGLPLVIFIFTSFTRTIPIQISECAFVEGASHLMIYTLIIMPLLKPVISTVIVISGLSIWNDFFGPLILITRSSLRTLPLTIFHFTGMYSANWPAITACLVILVLPILIVYVVLQKHIIGGVVAGSVKG